MTGWVSGALGRDHDLEEFASGQPSLDDWLRRHARDADARGTARTWVWTAPDSARVVAYYSVAPTQVLREDLSRAQAGGASVVPELDPGYLLARLALDSSLHGQRLGAALLVDAVRRIVAAAEISGGRLIVVDAIDANAEGFYARHDFQPIPSSASGSFPRRMVMKIATARRALA